MAKLYFYYSAMNAGKTTYLLQSHFNYTERSMKCALFLPSIIGKNKIQSRIGISANAEPFESTFDFHTHIQELRSKPQCIMVDEAHFLTKTQVQQLGRVADDEEIPVLCFGLRSDFNGEPFDGSKYLLILADKLVEIKTICLCGKKATMNKRLNSSTQQVDIGGNDKYISLCRKCYNTNAHC